MTAYDFQSGQLGSADEIMAALANSVGTATGGTAQRFAMDRFGEVANVLDFGAVNDGSVDTTVAMQDAVDKLRDAGGGLLRIPSGTYLMSDTINVPANVTVAGDGRGRTKLLASSAWSTSSGRYAFFENDNYDAGSIVDENITIRDLTIDYGDFGAVNPSGGGQHAIRMWFARRVLIDNVEFQLRTAEDAVAGRACQDLIVRGCFGYAAINCMWDFWEECEGIVLEGLFAESSQIEQMVNFNPERTGGPNVGRVARGFTMTNCHFRYLGASAAPILLAPLASGNSVRNVVAIGNRLENTYFVLRGDTAGGIVANNVISDVAGGLSAIETYTYLSGAPAGISITGNVIIDPATVSGNLGVIHAECDGAVISGNTITGSAYGSVPGIYCGTAAVTLGVNHVSNGTVTATAGVLNTANTRIKNNLQLGFFDTSGRILHMKVQSDDNFVITGINASGNPRTLASVQQGSNSAPWLFPIVVTFQNQMRQKVAATVAAAGTDQAGATDTDGHYIVITSASAGSAQGVALQDGAGASQVFWNKTAVDVDVYPPGALHTIDGGSAGAAVTLAAGAICEYVCIAEGTFLSRPS